MFVTNGSLSFQLRDRLDDVVEKYDEALRQSRRATAAKNKTIEKVLRERRRACNNANLSLGLRDRSVIHAQREKERADLLEKDLVFARETVEGVAKERLEREKAALAEEMAKEVGRLRRSRVYEVTMERMRVQTAMLAQINRRFGNIWEHQALRNLYDEKCSLLGQGSGVKNCLTLLKDKGADIPQSSIDLFAAKKARFEELSVVLKVEDIPAEDLSLSPLRVESRFFDEVF